MLDSISILFQSDSLVAVLTLFLYMLTEHLVQNVRSFVFFLGTMTFRYLRMYYTGKQLYKINTDQYLICICTGCN